MDINRDDEQWQACPEGELSRMVDRIRSGHRQRAFNRAAAVVAVLLVGATAAGLAAPWLRDNALQRNEGAWQHIDCADVIKLLPAYAQHALDSELMQRVRHHLDACPACRHHLEQVRGQTGRASAAQGLLVRGEGWPAQNHRSGVRNGDSRSR